MTNNGDFAQAIAELTKAIQLNPNDHNAHFNLGYIYYKQGDYVRSIASLDQAIQLHPDDAEAYLGRGLAYAKQGNTVQALSEYNKATELNPNYSVRTFTADCYMPNKTTLTTPS